MLFSSRKRNKIFCIGRNKTGTTSIGAALSSLGFDLCSQDAAELLMEDWAVRDFRRIVKLCESADAFQDVPFSLDYTYQILDYQLPNSKFILTVRDNSEIWFRSLVNYHTKLVNKGRLPTVEDLKECNYRTKGWLWRQQQLVYGANEKTLYDMNLYTSHYLKYNRRVIEYFKYRPECLLVINLNSPDSSKDLLKFINIQDDTFSIPKLNKSP